MRLRSQGRLPGSRQGRSLYVRADRAVRPVARAMLRVRLEVESGGSSPVSGLPDQNCCPADRNFNAVTNTCEPGNPGNPGTPHLTIVKSAPDSCTTKSNDG